MRGQRAHRGGLVHRGLAPARIATKVEWKLSQGQTFKGVNDFGSESANGKTLQRSNY
jgi:hypothetical protein